MENTEAKTALDAEISNFRILEEKVDLLLQRLSELKAERDNAFKQKAEIETILRRRETELAQLRNQITEAEQRAIDPRKTAEIKERLNSLIEKLDDFT